LDSKSIFVGWGFSFPIVLVSRYKLSLCHTPIKPDLLDFSGIDVFVWPRAQEVHIIWYQSLASLIRFWYRKKKKRSKGISSILMRYYSKRRGGFKRRGGIKGREIKRLVFVIFMSHSCQTWFTWLSGNWCLCMWVAWPLVQKIHISLFELN
jgi:hypothetical protein